MYLKSLTLKGFKSFANRTHMSFDPGLTVVVGPNGSGKSNVSDAILWVLGEQSARMLRGQVMEDVIFSGSSARQPVGVAEVTLVLDNTDHTLPVDFSEVGITRRMYRSGESEYLINGAPARLRDIQDILHDSGLGKETHSIISQGKLDSILQSRPEERRELIEEAAGISKHRRRKERSQRKLASMDDNLRRAKDVAREISRQLKPLERQVDKARRAEDLTKRLSNLETTLAVDDLRNLQAEWNKLDTRGREASAELELANYRFDERSRELDKLQSMLEKKGLFVGDLGEQRRRTQDMLGRLESDMRLLEEKGRNMVSRLSEARASLSSIERQRSEAASQLEHSQDDLASSAATLAQLEEDVADLGPKAAEARKALQAKDSRIEQLTAEQRSLQRQADEETLAYARLSEQVSNAEVEDAMFASRISQLEETIATCDEALLARRDRIQGLGEEIDDAEAALTDTTSTIERLRKELDEATSAEDCARRALSEAQASLAALRSVDEAQALASPLVQSLCNDEKTSELVQCRLSDLIDVPPEFEELVERLLGDDLATLVVANESSLERVVGRALDAASSGGRAVIASLANAPVPQKTNSGELDLLIDHLAVTDEARGLVTALLGDVALAPNLVEALRSHEANPGFCFVTLDGATVLEDGRCVVGTSGAEAGALERKRRIRALDDGMGELELKLQEASATHEQLTQSLAEMREAQAQATGKLATLKGELSSVTSDIGRLEAQQTQATDERNRLQRQREEASAKAAEARPKLAEHREKAQEAQENAGQIAQLLEDLAEERKRVAENEAQAAAKLSEARLSLATVRERKRHVEERADELSRRLTSLESRRGALEDSARSLDVLRLRVDPLHERYEAIHEVALAWASRLRDRASLAEADSDSLKNTIGEAKARLAEAESARDSARETLNEVRVLSGKLEVQVQAAVSEISERSGVSLEEALGFPAPEDREAMEREVADIKRKIADIGPVNQVAMEEYTRLKERSDYIAEQVSDLEQARGALAKIAAAIDRKMRNQFLDTFAKVNKNFKEVFALLFPGGRANLEMTDPDHPSETGIEIVAQPLGKRLSKMTLMSGGEKSLTALALLFAVYRTRTVPFYVFDEVEAALDDSNLDKLLGAIESLKATTQLIVISHQRRTMEQADVLYGVSMQADGVSRVVSQRLDHATGKVVDA